MQNRRTALKILGTSCAAIALPSKLSASDPTLVKPIRLGVIADLHGGLAVDAESRLDTFLNSMADKNVDALIQMGDFAYPNQKHQRFSDKFNGATRTPSMSLEIMNLTLDWDGKIAFKRGGSSRRIINATSGKFEFLFSMVMKKTRRPIQAATTPILAKSNRHGWLNNSNKPTGQS